MAIEKTFSIVKPDALKRNILGQIESQIEAAGLEIVAAKMLHLSREQAEGFYAEHKGKAFYEPLVDYMTSGRLVVQVLQGEQAISQYRQLMGATNPDQADEGTLRAQFALSMRENSVHGSDSPESAAREIAYFFAQSDIC